MLSHSSVPCFFCSKLLSSSHYSLLSVREKSPVKNPANRLSTVSNQRDAIGCSYGKKFKQTSFVMQSISLQGKRRGLRGAVDPQNKNLTKEAAKAGGLGGGSL